MTHQGKLLLNPTDTGSGKLLLTPKKKKKKKKKTVGSVILARLKRDRKRAKKSRKKLPKALRILTSPKTTAVLGTTLGALLFPAKALGLASSLGRGVVKTFTGKTALGTIGRVGAGFVGAGVISSSPKVRSFLRTKVSPAGLFSRGKQLGGLIEDPSKLAPQQTTTGGVKERVLDIFKTAGLIGGAAALGVGGVVLAKKGIAGLRGLRGEQGIAGMPAGTVAFQQFPVSVPATAGITQPLGAVQKTIEPTPALPMEKAIPSIKIVNKPQNIVNVSFRKSKKFINQQVLIKS